MKIEFFYEFTPPKTTNQQRRQSSTGGYLHDAGRVAKATWQAVLEQWKPGKPLVGPVRLTLYLTWKHTKASQQRSRKDGGFAVPKITRPDGDNLIKMIKDVMQQVGYFEDDAQVFDERIVRWHGDIEGVFVSVEEVPYSVQAEKAKSPDPDGE